MGSSENPNWFLDSFIDDIPVTESDLSGNSGVFYWANQGFDPSSNVSARSEICYRPATKACREKMRRDKLNDSDAARMLTQLRNEAQKLKETNETLEEKIKELKAEKNELRDEKHRLKAEKESLEQQMKLITARSSYVPHPAVIPTPFTVQSQVAGHKLMMPIIGYPSLPMWQFMPPADVDTSQDAEKCPPVA